MTSITGLSVTLSVVALLGYLLVLVDGFIGLAPGITTQLATSPASQNRHAVRSGSTSATAQAFRGAPNRRFPHNRHSIRSPLWSPGSSTTALGFVPAGRTTDAVMTGDAPRRRGRSGIITTTKAMLSAGESEGTSSEVSAHLCSRGGFAGTIADRSSSSRSDFDGMGGGLEAFHDGSGPPRIPGVGRWGGGGGGGDGGRGGGGGQGDGDGREDFAALGAAQVMMAHRQPQRSSAYGGGGGGRVPSNRRPTRMVRRQSNIQRNAVATKVLTALNVLVFILQTRFPSITTAGWKLAPAITQQGQWYRLLTPVVLHGSLAHLAVNSMSFNSVGPVVEAVLGTKKFLAVYALAGIAGNALSCIVNPATPAVGASGAIFGMVGAWGAFWVMNQAVLGRDQSQRVLKGIGQTIMINVVYGMSISQVDNMGHLGGFLGGALVTFAIGPRLRRRLNPITGEPYMVDTGMMLSLPRLGGGRGHAGSSGERRWPSR